MIVAGTAGTGTLRVTPFRSDRFVVVVPQSDRLAENDSIAFVDVLDRDLVGLDQASALQPPSAD